MNCLNQGADKGTEEERGDAIPAHKSLKHCLGRANSPKQGNSSESIIIQTNRAHIEPVFAKALMSPAASEVHVAFTAQGGEVG